MLDLAMPGESEVRPSYILETLIMILPNHNMFGVHNVLHYTISLYLVLATNKVCRASVIFNVNWRIIYLL